MKYLQFLPKIVTLLFLSLLASSVLSEPYLAVKEGFTCGQCHINRAGGGQRTVFGNLYAQQTLSLESFSDQKEPAWTGTLVDRLSVGGNGRFSARQFDLDNSEDDDIEFATDRVTVYATLQLNSRVSFYVDQQIAPGGSLNREVWGRISWDKFYAKAGKIFLPYGWRLEDDSAFIRRSTGINFNNGDNGIEFGWNEENWQWQLAITNGTSGGGEVDSGKFVTSRLAWVSSALRLGASVGNNNTDLGDRTMYGVFAGLKTGPVAWLAEIDRIEDEGFGLVDSEQNLSLIEANIEVLKGHNLKLTYEIQNFEDNQIDRTRASLLWEYFPWAFTQFRAGARQLDAESPTFDEGKEFFVQAHFYF